MFKPTAIGAQKPLLFVQKKDEPSSMWIGVDYFHFLNNERRITAIEHQSFM
jgi:hypothetical protein